MPSQPIVLGVVVAYLLACLILGMRASRGVSATAVGYVAGDRGLGLLVMYFVTGASVFSAFAFLGAPGWAYGRGVAALYILAFGTFGLLPYYFLGPRAARVGRVRGYVTLGEMIAGRFAMPGLAGVLAVVTIVALVPYLALQMRGAGYVLAAVSGGAVGERVGAAIVYAVVLAYVLRSGVLGVGWTNTFQGVFMLVMAWGLGLYLPDVLYGGIGPMFERIAEQRPELLDPPGLTGAGTPWPWSEYASAVLVSSIGFSFWPHLFMKAFSARDERTVRRTVVLYPTFQLFLVPILLIGFAGVLFETSPGRPDEILPHMLMRMDLPAWIVGLFCAGAVAASMSSGDAIAHAAGSVAVRDGWGAALGRSLSPRAERGAIRIAIVAVMAVSYGLACVYRGSLVNLLLYAYGAVVQFAPAVVATLCWRGATGAGVCSGVIAGILVTGAFVAWPQVRPWEVHAGLFGIAANVGAVVLVSRCTRRVPVAGAAFLEIARRRPEPG